MRKIEIFYKKKLFDYSLIDDEDWDRCSAYKWRISGSRLVKGYAVFGNAERLRLHRLVLNLQSSDKVIVDHIDGNTLNNCKSNLRVCTPHENQRNRVVNRTKTSSIYKGVHRKKGAKLYFALINTGDKIIQESGYFDEISAAQGYDRLAREYFGDFCRLNFPDINDYTHLLFRR